MSFTKSMKVLPLKELCYLTLCTSPHLVSRQALCADIVDFLKDCDKRGWCAFCAIFVGKNGFWDYTYHDRDCSYFVEYLYLSRNQSIPVLHLDGRRCEHCDVAITPDSEEAVVFPLTREELGLDRYHDILLCSRVCPALLEEVDLPYLYHCEGCYNPCFVPLKRWESGYDAIYANPERMFREWTLDFLCTLHAGSPTPYIPLCSDACERTFKEEVGIRWCPKCNKDMCTGFPYDVKSYQRHLRECPSTQDKK